MVSNSIYPSCQELHILLSQNSNLSNQLVQTYLSNRIGNPSVVNMKFRQILESAGFNYHKQGYSPKEIAYRIQNNDWGYHYCHSCGKEISKFHSFETGFTRHCCAKCCAKNPATYEERKKFNQKKYGVDNVFQSKVVKKKMADTCQKKYAANRYQQTAEFSAKMTATAAKRTKETRAEITEKRKATNIEKFGVEFPLQSLEIQQQLKDTCMKKYGVDNPQKSAIVQEKTKNTCVERFGAKTALLSEIIQQKIKAIFQEKYGVDNPSQRAGWEPAATRKSNRVYIFQSGTRVNVQGYEPLAIDKLLSEGYIEQDIQLTNRPSIKYFWPSDDGCGDNKWHYYHPDIIIPAENRIIEVKSSWTFSGRNEWVSKNFAKKKRCIDLGYTFEFWILTSSGEITVL
jgi:cell pole-organizing protein PopZ